MPSQVLLRSDGSHLCATPHRISFRLFPPPCCPSGDEAGQHIPYLPSWRLHRSIAIRAPRPVDDQLLRAANQKMHKTVANIKETATVLRLLSGFTRACLRNTENIDRRKKVFHLSVDLGSVILISRTILNQQKLAPSADATKTTRTTFLSVVIPSPLGPIRRGRHVETATQWSKRYGVLSLGLPSFLDRRTCCLESTIPYGFPPTGGHGVLGDVA